MTGWRPWAPRSMTARRHRPTENWRKLSRHPDLVDCLYLVRNGVPFDVAFCLPADERLAWVVALGTLGGGEFDFVSMRWKERP